MIFLHEITRTIGNMSNYVDINQALCDASQASRKLAFANEEMINEVLRALADEISIRADEILDANAADLALMNEENPKFDRLKLTRERLTDIASDMRHVATLPSPVGKTLEERTLPNGLELKKVSVPFGVIGVIYEARPNVSFDVFALCFKSGNACVLKGGHEADRSNRAIVRTIHAVLNRKGFDPNCVVLLPPDREATLQLLHANGKVDLIIPRGSSRLISFVRQEATVPVIETGAGICHTYFDAAADLSKGTAIVNNAKTRRVSVCNALDCLLVHEARLTDLPALCAPLADSRVVIYADGKAYNALHGHYPENLLHPATPEDYGTEFLDYKMAIRTVASPEEAIAHIHKYGSKHSESIITEDEQTANLFARAVDAACVYVNAPTSFTDGAQFGLGAEIGISTQKLHARGPMGLKEITTYKWLIKGNGQIRK